MCSFPNAVTEIVCETITTRVCGGEGTRVPTERGKNFANYSDVQLQLAPHSKCERTAAAEKEEEATVAPRTTMPAAGHRSASGELSVRANMQRVGDVRVYHKVGQHAPISNKYGEPIRTERRRRRAAWESFAVIRAIRWAISFVLVIDSAYGLRLTNMTAPMVADTRDDMRLDCHFDMGAEQLYAVKWYKDDQEFFRYMPHQEPHTLAFPVAGVHMKPTSTACDETRCNLLLTNLTRQHSGGAFRCEVSTEAPAFRLASETHNVTVATLPLDKPRITGLADAYAMDDMLTLECISGAGDPTPKLTWYINNQPATADVLGEPFTTQVYEKTPQQQDAQRLEAAAADGYYRTGSVVLTKRTQALRARIERKHLQGAGALVVRCTSTLPNMPMIQPQSEVRSVIVRSRSGQVNNEKLHWPDYISTSAASMRSGLRDAVVGGLLLIIHCRVGN